MSRIRQQIAETWGKDSPHVLIFARLLEKLKPNSTQYLPLSQLRDLCGRDIPDSEFDRAIFWFSSDAIKLLEARYEYIEGDVDEGDISPIELANAIRSGGLTLSSGIIVKDFRGHLYPYFCGTSSLESELRLARGSHD